MSLNFELVEITEKKVKVGQKTRSLIFHFKDSDGNFWPMRTRCINKHHLTLNCTKRQSKNHRSGTCPFMLNLQLTEVKTEKVLPQVGRVRYQLSAQSFDILTDVSKYGEVFHKCRMNNCNHLTHSCTPSNKPTWPKRKFLAEASRLKTLNPSLPSSQVFSQVAESQNHHYGEDGARRPAGWLWQQDISQKTVSRAVRYTKQSLSKSITDVSDLNQIPNHLINLETIEGSQKFIHEFDEFIILCLPSEPSDLM